MDKYSLHTRYSYFTGYEIEMYDELYNVDFTTSDPNIPVAYCINLDKDVENFLK